MNRFWRTVAGFALGVALAGCGGSGGEAVQAPEEERVYGHIPVEGATRAPYIELDSDWHVGANIAPSEAHRRAMTDVGEREGVDVHHGRVRDRTSREELAAYIGSIQADGGHIERQGAGLDVLLPSNADAVLREYATRAIRIVNEALPENVQLTLGTGTVTDDGTLTKEDVEHGTLVIVERQQEGGFAGRGGTIARPSYDEWLGDRERTAETLEEYSRFLASGYRTGGWVEIDPDVLEAIRNGEATDWRERGAVSTFVHELIHAMGILGHPDPERFTESVMSYGDDHDNPHIIYPMDYDVIWAAYTLLEPMSQRTEIGPGHWRTESVRYTEELAYEALGPWDDSSSHIVGELAIAGGTVEFGARASNGMAQAWARGPKPYTIMGLPLRGTATWQGALLGMTPNEEAVIGGANLQVDLEAHTGTLAFSAMEYWAPRATPGGAGTGTQWNDGALEYDVGLEDGTFTRTGGDDGVVTGTFFGGQYQGMGGVVQRSDLVAAFGGEKM